MTTVSFGRNKDGVVYAKVENPQLAFVCYLKMDDEENFEILDARQFDISHPSIRFGQPEDLVVEIEYLNDHEEMVKRTQAVKIEHLRDLENIKHKRFGIGGCELAYKALKEKYDAYKAANPASVAVTVPVIETPINTLVKVPVKKVNSNSLEKMAVLSAPSSFNLGEKPKPFEFRNPQSVSSQDSRRSSFQDESSHESFGRFNFVAQTVLNKSLEREEKNNSILKDIATFFISIGNAFEETTKILTTGLSDAFNSMRTLVRAF